MQIFKYPKLWWLKIVVACLCFIVDYCTKEWARNYLPKYGTCPFIPHFLQLTFVTNTGAAFNLGSGHGLLMTLIATAVTIWLIAWVLREGQGPAGQSLLMSLGAGFLIGGACGNLFDRFVRGRVTDFLEFSFFQFPVFNVADVCIDIGIGLIIIFALRNKPSQTRSDSAQP